MKQVIQIHPEVDPESLSDEQLVMAHMSIHAYYREFRQGRGEQMDGWTVEEVIETHQEIADELEQRELGHERMSGLDEEAAPMAQGESIEFDGEVEEQPDEAEWMFQALDFVEMHDKTLDMNKFVSMAFDTYEDFSVWQKDWADHTFEDPESVGLIAFEVNQDTNTSVFFVKDFESDQSYQLYLNDVKVHQTDKQELAFSWYRPLAEMVYDGASVEQAYKKTFLKQGRVIDTDQDHRWYVWDGEEEANGWLRDHDYNPDDMATGQEGNMLGYEVDGSDFEDYRQEWQGNQNPPSDDFSAEDAREGDTDERPVLFRYGIQEGGDDADATLATILFQVEEPDESDQSAEQGLEEIELNQFGVIQDPSEDYKWYVWNRTEAEQWVREQGYDAELERDGDYLVANLRDDEGTYRSWRGSRAVPEDGDLPEQSKPRRVAFAEDEDGERVPSTIEFPYRRTYAQLAESAAKTFGLEREQMENLLGLK